MFEKYRKEREDVDCIKTDKGFIFYKIEFPGCLICDYYVLPEFRQSGHGYFLANQVFQICKEAGIEFVYCQTDDLANGVEISKHTILNFGFEEIGKTGSVSNYKMGVMKWVE